MDGGGGRRHHRLAGGIGRAASATGVVDLVSPGGSVTDLTRDLDGDGEMARWGEGYSEVVVTSDGAG